MPINSLSVGRDCTVTLYDPISAGIVTVNLTSFDAKQEGTMMKSKRLDGHVQFGFEPEGWSGSFMIDRNGPSIDILFDILERAYYAGRNIAAQVINEIIQEPDGTVTQWRFSGVALKYDDAGPWKGSDFIKQKISWSASLRERVV